MAEEGDHIAATIGQPPGDAGADRPALLQSALDALDVGVSLFDVNLNAVAFNRRFLEILDLPVGQFRPGDPFAAFIRFNAERGEYGPGDVEEQVSERVTLARRFETHRFERTRPDGLVIEIDGRPLPDGGFITTYTDMTARRCAEAETARLAAIVETTDAAIFTQDTAGRVSSWNAGAARLFGYDAGEMLGQRLDRLDLGEGTGESSRLLRRALRGEPVRQRETRRRRKDGHPVDVILTVTPMLGDNGKPVGVSTVAHDDTARKQGEAALVRAKDASEEATRTKSEFLANMSHEIRTPMNGVIGMTELLSETELDSVQREYVETVRRSAGHLLSIVDDVLDFSKIEAGKLDLEAVPFNLSALVEDSCSLLAERARSKGLELLCFVQSDVPRGVVGDPTRLAQVLTNLLGNAVKFTHRGEVVVRVTAVPAGTARARLRFEVEDTGIGISPQQCERLFQPFSQGDGSTTRRFGGTGLGLSISRQLVGLMGGSLEVSSDPGHGSVFSFELDMEERPLRGLEANPGAGLDGFRLLVVDDNATNCTILSHHLQTWGVDHDVVGDAGRALDLLGVAALRGIPYGLVLADYHMPGTDGLELTRRIKLAPGLADTPVVILSSGGFDLKAVTEAGVRLCLTKPVRASRLHDALAEVLAHSAHGRETQAGRTAPEQATKAQFPVLEGRVLLAEDNAVNRKVATEMLRRLGLEVATARDGREALQMVQAERFDLVLMDCQMPELDGLEATRRLRDSQSDGTLRTPIIALTANAMKGDRDRCLAAGMDDYLAKPVRLGALARCLTRWLPGEAPAPPDPEQVERADARAPATGGD